MRYTTFSSQTGFLRPIISAALSASLAIFLGLLTPSASRVAAGSISHGMPANGAPPAPPARPSLIRPAKNILLSDFHFNPLAGAERGVDGAASPLLTDLQTKDITQWDKVLSASGPKTFPPPPPYTYTTDGSNPAQETNYPILTSCLRSAAGASLLFRGVVIYTGDLLPHDYLDLFTAAGGAKEQYPAFATKTARYVVWKMQKTLKAPVVVAMGNNDSTLGDYITPPLPSQNPLYKGLGDTIQIFTANKKARAEFLKAGYYSIPNPIVKDQDIVVLNTVFWSDSEYNYSNCDFGQMAWLTQKLKGARKARRKVCLVMHIPPGYDAFSSARNNTHKRMWRRNYELDFIQRLKMYKSVLVTSFAGHTHMDDFRVISDGNVPFVVIRTTPSVTPFFGNNPAFSVFTYTLNFSRYTSDVRSLTTFYAPMTSLVTSSAGKGSLSPTPTPSPTPPFNPSWRIEYQFKTAYPKYQPYGPKALHTFSSDLRKYGTGSSIYSNYRTFYNASAVDSKIDAVSLKWFIDAQTKF